MITTWDKRSELLEQKFLWSITQSRNVLALVKSSLDHLEVSTNRECIFNVNINVSHNKLVTMYNSIIYFFHFVDTWCPVLTFGGVKKLKKEFRFANFVIGFPVSLWSFWTGLNVAFFPFTQVIWKITIIDYLYQNTISMIPQIKIKSKA